MADDGDVQHLDAWSEWNAMAHERRRLAGLDYDWRDDALCKIENIPTSVFFPERKRGDVAAAEARQHCMRCPVREDCAGYALEAGLNHGVYGGASPRQRQKMRAMGTLDVLQVLKPKKKG